MVCIKERYFRLNRIILLAIGLWPYQQSSKLVRLQLTLFLGILMSYVIFQLIRLLLLESSFEFIIEMLSVLTFFIFVLIKYLSFLLNMEIMRYLIERLQYVHNDLQDVNEIAIYDKYGKIAKRVTVMLILVGINGLSVFIGIQCYPYFIDIIMSKNDTHKRYLVLLLSKYYVMDEKYFDMLIVYYVFILHMNLLWAAATFVLVSIGTMMLSYLILICGMFKIASYRLERAITGISPSRSVSSKKEFMPYKQVICAVDIHRKAMESADLFKSNFEGLFFFVVVITICCLSLNLFRVFQIALHTNKRDESFIIHIVFIMVILLYIFATNYIGQEITDHNNYMFFTAYNIQWYASSLGMQKMILFLLQRGCKIFILKLGGLFTPSLGNFASMTSASISYFTVIYSNQE
ncbi:Or9e48 [Eciton burchellii]|nr:Or9e48 [Eciton burchellii]